MNKTKIRKLLAGLPAPETEPFPVAADWRNPGPGEHTCEAGPLCLGWDDDPAYGCRLPGQQVPAIDFDASPELRPDHNSCLRIMHGPGFCQPCELEAQEAMAAEMDEWDAVNEPAQRGVCPDCGAALAFAAIYGAPGTGDAWECGGPVTHHFARVGGAFYRPEWGVHILEPEDVI